MTVLAHARAMSYEVGTNLKGRSVGAWTLLLPSLEIGAAVVVGQASTAELTALDRLVDLRIGLDDFRRIDSLGERHLDLVLVGRGGGDLLDREDVRGALAERLAPTGVAYGETRGEQRVLDRWDWPTRRLALWPAFGAARVIAPSDDLDVISRLSALGFLPPRGSASLTQRALNRAAEWPPLQRRWRRSAEVSVGHAASLGGPPAYVVDIARAAGVDIGAAPWALLAPGDYPSQKALLILFDAVDHTPNIVVKLGIDPNHAGRLRNEAAALALIDSLGLPQGTYPTLRFAGEHAGRALVGQDWLSGRSFSTASSATVDSPQLADAVAWFTTLARSSVRRRPAREVGAALRDLFDRFRSIHHLPEEETSFLERQVRAVEQHSGMLPVVFQHGDPGTWNLLVDDAGRVAFLDWESSESDGMPLWDLVHFQFSFGAQAARREGTRRRLPAAVRHFTTSTPLQARFAAQLADLAAAVDLPRELVEPLVFAGWMLRALKEATRSTPATLERGLYLRMLRELVRRRDEPSLRLLLANRSP